MLAGYRKFCGSLKVLSENKKNWYFASTDGAEGSHEMTARVMIGCESLTCNWYHLKVGYIECCFVNEVNVKKYS